MIRRDHAVLTALAVGGALLTLFQNWYISLPLEEAARIDICRITERINCFRSLHSHGEDLLAFGLPAFPALAGLFLFQASLCGFAWFLAEPRRDAWLALARVASLPASGLCIFVLLHDLTVAKATSASAILVGGASIWISVLAVLHPTMSGLRPKSAGLPAAGLAVVALLAGFFLHGAGSSRRAHDAFRREQEAALPSVAYPFFAHAIPRRGAASLGDTLAPREFLMLVDPAQESSRELMRMAAKGIPEGWFLTIYARGEAGAHLILAHRAGTLAAYLKDPQKPPAGDPGAAVLDLVKRQEAAWKGRKAPAILGPGREWTRAELEKILGR